MDHEDFEQLVAVADGMDIYVTLCRCGKAFWDEDSQQAYSAWEQHEADES